MRCLKCGLDGLPALTKYCPNPNCYADFAEMLSGTLPAGSLLHDGKYRIDYPLGRGGFGITYRAMHAKLEKVFAIKEFYPKAIAIRDGKGGFSIVEAQRETFRKGLERFLRESRILADIEHQNIARVTDFFEERGTAYLVMEFIKGKTLRDELEAQPQKRLSSERILGIFGPLIEALEVIHNKNVYHLDIKPENVLIAEGGRVVLLDFGAARQGFSRDSTQTKTDIYAPPEILVRGDLVGPQSDIFELGMTIHEMLTGELPPPANERTVRKLLLKMEDWKPEGLEEPWDSLLTAALKLSKEERPASALEWWKPAMASRKPSFSLQTYEFNTVRLDAKGDIVEKRKGNAGYYVEDLGGIGLDMVSIPGGSFLMGTADADVERVVKEYTRYWGDAKQTAEWVRWETPQHRVTLQPFYMGKYPVTQAQWRAVAALPKVSRDLDPEPSNFKGDLPVEQVSWEDAIEFCARLSNKSGRAYRLPSEAEWEYACRAGTSTPFAFGETITPEIVNYAGNYPYGSAPKGEYRQKTMPVGSLGAANGFGLYDMHGNVWEWQQDAWHGNYNGAPNDGGVWEADGDNTYRVLRGGSWFNLGYFCRSALRRRYVPGSRYSHHGFRVVIFGARTL